MKTKSVALILLSSLALAACHHAPEKSKASKGDGLAFPQSSDVLSKWVRVHVADYWSFARQNSLLASYPASGVVMGDAHLANFGPLPVQIQGGAVEMRYLDIDFDDAGHAPFALDFLRLVITSKATKESVKIKEMVEGYVKGLRGETVAAPSEINPFLTMSLDDYRKSMDEDLDGKTSSGSFKLKAGKIEAYKGTLTRAELQTLVPQITVSDVASRPEVDSENAGSSRIWIYGKDKLGLRRLFELKAYAPTALSAYQPQLEKAAWSADVRQSLWPDVARGEYELIDLPGRGSFWLREKKLTLIDVPYSSKDKSALLYVRHLAAYDSYILGQLHGHQASAAGLRDQLSNPVAEAAFQESIKEAAQIYLNDISNRH